MPDVPGAALVTARRARRGCCSPSGRWRATGWRATSAGDLRRFVAVLVLGGGFWLASFLVAYRLRALLPQRGGHRHAAVRASCCR